MSSPHNDIVSPYSTFAGWQQGGWVEFRIPSSFVNTNSANNNTLSVEYGRNPGSSGAFGSTVIRIDVYTNFADISPAQSYDFSPPRSGNSNTWNELRKVLLPFNFDALRSSGKIRITCTKSNTYIWNLYFVHINDQGLNNLPENYNADVAFLPPLGELRPNYTYYKNREATVTLDEKNATNTADNSLVMFAERAHRMSEKNWVQLTRPPNDFGSSANPQALGWWVGVDAFAQFIIPIDWWPFDNSSFQVDSNNNNNNTSSKRRIRVKIGVTYTKPGGTASSAKVQLSLLNKESMPLGTSVAFDANFTNQTSVPVTPAVVSNSWFTPSVTPLVFTNSEGGRNYFEVEPGQVLDIRTVAGGDSSTAMWNILKVHISPCFLMDDLTSSCEALPSSELSASYVPPATTPAPPPTPTASGNGFQFSSRDGSPSSSQEGESSSIVAASVIGSLVGFAVISALFYAYREKAEREKKDKEMTEKEVTELEAKKKAAEEVTMKRLQERNLMSFYPPQPRIAGDHILIEMIQENQLRRVVVVPDESEFVLEADRAFGE